MAASPKTETTLLARVGWIGMNKLGRSGWSRSQNGDVRDTAQTTWRFASSLRAACWIITVVAASGAIAAVSGSLFGGQPARLVFGLALVAVLAGLVAAGVYRAGVRPFVAADDTCLTVRNPLSEHHIPWADVARVASERFGLSIYRVNDTPIRVWIVQDAAHGPRAAPTRADRLASVLADILSARPSAEDTVS